MKERITAALWTVIQKPLSWTKEMQCITVTGECAENVSVIETSVFMFGGDCWDCSLRAAAHSKLGNYTEATETVNERLPSTRRT